MAGRKNTGKDFDDFNIDDLDDDLMEFGFGDDDLDPNSRSPISRVKSGAKMGFKGTIDSPDFRKRFLKGALPKEYSKGIEGADELLQEGRRLYNTTSEEVRRTGREARDFLSRTMPSASKYVPKGLSEALNRWLGDKEDEARQEQHQKNVEEAEIATTLGEIFKTQADEDAKKQEAAELKRSREKIVQRRQFASQQGLLAKLTELSERQVAYQDTVTIAYQRKHLELEMRQYNVLRNIHSVLAKDSENQDKIQRGILKNTGLPDFQKIRQSEAFRAHIRDRLFGTLSSGPLSGVNNLIRGFAKNVTDNFLGTFRDTLGSVRDAMTAGDMGIDKYTLGGAMGGSFAAERAGRFVGRRIRRIAERNPALRRAGHRFSRSFGDAERYLNTFASGDPSEDTYRPQFDEEGNEIKEGLFQRLGRVGRRFVRQNLPTYRPDQTLLVRSRPGSLNEPDLITNRFTRTVEEVVPKLLSMIYGEVRSARTGQPVESFHYDFSARKVVADRVAAEGLRDRLFSTRRRQEINEDVNRVIGNIDQGGGLSDSARALLRKRIIEDARHGRQFNPEQYASGRGWAEGASASDVAEIRAAIQKRYGYVEGKGYGRVGNTEAAITETDENLRRLSNFLPLGKNDVLNMVRAGHLDAAVATGLVDQTDQGWFFNEEKYMDHLLSGTTPDIDVGSAYGGSMAKSRRRRSRGAQQGQSAQAIGALRSIEKLNDGVTQGFQALGNKIDGISGIPKDQLDRLVDSNELSTAWLEEISEQVRNIQAYGIHFGEVGERIREGYGNVKTKAGEFADSARDRAQRFMRQGRVRRRFAKRWVKQKASEIQDAYVKGRESIALRAELIRNGEYVDVETGKVVSKLSDITGEVRNKAGDVVLTAEEFKDGLLDKHGDKIAKVAASAETFVRDTVPTFFSAIPSFLRETREQARNLLDGPEDVYVGKSKKPRLFAHIMREGGYFLKDSGKMVRRPVDITGEVVDKEGNVVLSAEDFEAGLNDKRGRPFEGITGKVRETLRGIRGRLEGGALNALTFAQSVGSKALGVIGNAIGNLEGFSFPGLMIGGQKQVIESIDRIYNLLAPKFGAEPLGPLGGVKETASKALNAKRWLTDRAGQLRRRAEATKRLMQRRRRQADESGEGRGFGIPGMPNLGMFKSAWERAKAMRERQGGRRGSWVNILRERRERQAEKSRKKQEGGGARKKGGGLGRIILTALGSAAGLMLGGIPGAVAGAMVGGKALRTLGGIIGLGFKAMPKIAKMIGWVAKKGFPLLGKLSFHVGKSIIKSIRDVGMLLLWPMKGMVKGIGRLGKSILTGFNKGGIFRKGGIVNKAVRGAPGFLKKAGSWLGRSALWAGRALATKALPWVAGAVMSPIGLAVGAVALLAFGGYKLYQYIKSKDSLLVRLRMIQYGIDYKDESQVNKIDRLEQALVGDVRITQDGIGKIDSRKDPKALLDIFDIKPDDEENIASWTKWFIGRFKPVFLRHIAAMKAIMDRYNVMGTQSDILKIDEKLPNWQAKYDFILKVKDGRKGRDEEESITSLVDDTPFPGIPLEYDYNQAYAEYYSISRRALKLRNEEIEDEGEFDTNDTASSDWSKTSEEKEFLRKERERIAAQREAAKGWRTREEQKAKKRLEDIMTLSKKAPFDAEKTQPLVDRARDEYHRISEQAAMQQASAANNEGWVWPTVPGHRISSMYGPRIHPTTGKNRPHKGIDVAAPEGTPIFAAYDGSIIRRAYSKTYGNVIYIKHPDGRVTRYAHMSRFEPGLANGSEVRAGQIIGYVGNTGVGTGPHLHFEVRKNDDSYADTVDPLTVIQDPGVQAAAQKAEKEAKAELANKDRDFKDDVDAPLEGEDTIASTLAGKATEPKGSAAEQDDSVPTSLLNETAKRNAQAKVSRERSQRPRLTPEITDDGYMSTLGQFNEQTRQQRIRREQTVRQQEIVASTSSAESTDRLVELNLQQLNLQETMRDSLLTIAEAATLIKKITEAKEKAREKEGKEGYRPNNPPSNELNPRPEPRVEPPSVISMR